MQAISLHPQRRLIVSKQIVLCVLMVLSALIPALALPLAMLMPLFSCPLIRGKEQWLAYASLPVPALLSLLYGAHPVYALGLLLAAGLPVTVTALLRKEEIGKPRIFFVYTFTAAISAAVALLGITLQGGEGLPQLAAREAVAFVMQHPQRTQLFYQALSTGLLPIPEGYSNVTLLNLVLDPVFISELKLALHTRVLQFVQSSLPSVFTNACIVLGLFTGLRVQRLRNAFLLVDREEPKKIRVAVTPGFSMLKIPQNWHWVMLLFMLTYFFSLGAKGVLLILTGILYSTFETVYRLQGAALVCGWIIKRDADRRILAGIIAALLYLLLPTVLFIIGCFERLFSFRKPTEDDNQDSDNHEEEEP